MLCNFALDWVYCNQLLCTNCVIKMKDCLCCSRNFPDVHVVKLYAQGYSVICHCMDSSPPNMICCKNCLIFIHAKMCIKIKTSQISLSLISRKRGCKIFLCLKTFCYTIICGFVNFMLQWIWVFKDSRLSYL
jgi:hypothetical protein